MGGTSGFDVYKRYVALKAHFNGSYDYFKHKGRTRASRESFERRRDKIVFERIGKKLSERQVQDFLVANLVHDKRFWAGDLVFRRESVDVYLAWRRRAESRSYTFRAELAPLDLDSCFECINSEYPALLRAYYEGDVSIETLIIALDVSGKAREWGKRLRDDIVWRETRDLIVAYKPFVHYDKERYREILRSMRHD